MKKGGRAMPKMHPTGLERAMIIVAFAFSDLGNQVMESLEGILSTNAYPIPPKS